MIVPTTISPIDYLKDTNEYVFYLEDFILKVDYTNQRFELMTMNDLSYTEDFSIVKNPPEWFETIDLGIVDWIRKAMDWQQPMLRSQFKYHKIMIDGVKYEMDYDSATSKLVVYMPGQSIITKRKILMDDYPEIQYIENGELVTEISEYISKVAPEGVRNGFQGECLRGKINFVPHEFTIGDNKYEIYFHLPDDIFFLRIPDRSIYTNLFDLETSAPELAERHNMDVYGIIREFVISNS